MRFILLPVGVLALAMTGCATTKSKTSMDQLQVRVVDLEQKIEEKDAEIVDLKYEVKDLASQIQSTKINEAPASSPAMASAGRRTGTDEGIIKVGASSLDVQTALKNAGFYHGTVDGKIGQQTKKAIQAFQEKYGIVKPGEQGYGDVGPLTRTILKGLSDSKP